MSGVARILIIDPSPEIRELLVRSVRWLGHQPLPIDELARSTLPRGDAAIVEPATDESFAAALELRAAQPELPIVCLSIYPRSDATAALTPVGYVLKPFSLAELENALTAAIAGSVLSPA
jgi:CheY-like chemotaxis protein